MEKFDMVSEQRISIETNILKYENSAKVMKVCALVMLGALRKETLDQRKQYLEETLPIVLKGIDNLATSSMERLKMYSLLNIGINELPFGDDINHRNILKEAILDAIIIDSKIIKSRNVKINSEDINSASLKDFETINTTVIEILVEQTEVDSRKIVYSSLELLINALEVNALRKRESKTAHFDKVYIVEDDSSQVDIAVYKGIGKVKLKALREILSNSIEKNITIYLNDENYLNLLHVLQRLFNSKYSENYSNKSLILSDVYNGPNKLDRKER